DHLFSKTELSYLPEVVISGMRAPSRVLLSGSFNNFGGMNVASLEPLSDEHFSILLRFAKVFDLTYTRFNDLQKAEAQAREAQIELALERVRGRAMAMHKSTELLDAGQILYNELLKLGIVSMTCGYVLMDEEEKIGWIYAASPADGTILQKPTGLPHTSAVMGSIKESWKKQEPFHIVELDPQATIEHHTYLATHSIDFLFTLEEFLAMSPEKVVMHSFNFKQGYLLVVSSTRLSSGQIDMVVRFTKVFEMTYRRFLDLQKAEGQAKEARIETALERVRAKAMAMHNSEDLAETIETFYHQMRSLGITPIRCGVGVITKEDRTCELTSMYTKEDGESVVILGNLLLSGHPLLEGIYDNWILQKEYRPLLRGNEIREYYQLVSGQVSYPDLRQSAVQHGYFFYFPEGGVYAWTETELHEEEIQIYRRFTSVLSLTYKRYNDLRLAEAQAREAQIQLSLERVRAKTMAMQRSEELAETAELLFEEFRKLSMVTVDQQGTDDRTTIGIFNEARGTYDLWITGLDGERLDHTYPISLQEPVNIAKAYSAWKAGKPSLVVDMQGAELNQWLDYMKTVGVPVKSNLYNKRRVNSWAFFSKGNLGITTNEPLPEESLQLLQRFADTFNLIYTRFQDLKDAEIRALEAVKEASLDRVRAEIASMRTADDLQRITPLVWRELTTLGVPFLRCGVFIVDEEKQNIHFYLSAPDGKALAALQLGFDSPGITRNVTAYWREQKVYLDHWSKEAFLQFAHDMESQGQIQSMNTYQGGEEAPESLTLQFVPFAQGMMYVGSAADLSAPQVALVQSLADAFSTAYARYEDFNKLEAAKQQIESTLKDLRATQTQLIQSEKMASLGELTAGIAHEIQNPLNFVNNFSEVSAELVDELNEALQKGMTAGTEQLAADLKDNLTKINHHGKRAADIVRGMLLHSRNSSGLKEPTDLNVLCDEYLRLAFHGYRAKDKSFNAGCETHFDPSLPQVNLIQQDMGRVVLNLINNAFYAVNERAKRAEAGYAPKVTVSTKKSAGTVEIIVTDNGPGIPESAVNKIFQPFFTTKPTGQGTGLGLSLSYDIVKAHGGQLLVETVAGDHTSFIIQLPQ
ncbi:MAG: hypothetical protein JWQ78_1465, partial [Sediminibacterium sp.]|nr:hypothetical protein [Sediminibacterium sp.]